MRKIIEELRRQYRAEERKVAFLDRAMDERRQFRGDGRPDPKIRFRVSACRAGQVNKRQAALKRMEDLSIAIEALRAIEDRPAAIVARVLA